MATSGTYAFAPSAGDLILNAFGLIQIRRWMLTTGHLTDAYIQSNLLMVEWSNRNPNRWAEERQEFTLSVNTPTYNLEDRTVAVSFVTIRTTTGSTNNDRVLGPLSSNDYEAIPNKSEIGFPSSYFFNLAHPTPTISFWLTPDDAQTYTARVTTFRQMQDVNLADQTQLDSPYRFLDAFTYGIAARLATMYPENLSDPRQADKLAEAAAAKFTLAAQRDQESAPMFITPMISGYYR